MNDKLLLESYNKVLREQLRDNVMEECLDKSVSESSYYLLHRPVVKENNVKIKVRIIYNASSKGMNCLSLNDCLLQGPSLLTSVLDLKTIWSLINHPTVVRYFASNNIKWQFSVEKVPWWEAFKEKLARNVKTALRKALCKSSLDRDQLEVNIIDSKIYLIPDQRRIKLIVGHWR
ncbi:hypothetical protein NPIL_355851 [Nephila pilipes]|uniref:Uncharacterized protein n=1 Tax=Nephila pilipes TaxID=299642 RepID=A0A8X6P7E7_NEPPI|nr:hypothetical protein NPIL_355851 [Nephila pilipes]